MNPARKLLVYLTFFLSATGAAGSETFRNIITLVLFRGQFQTWSMPLHACGIAWRAHVLARHQFLPLRSILSVKAPTSSIDTELQLLATKPTQFVTCHHLLYAYWYCHILFGCLNGRWAANRSWGVRGRLRARYIWSQNRCFLAVLVACPANCSEDV